MGEKNLYLKNYVISDDNAGVVLQSCYAAKKEECPYVQQIRYQTPNGTSLICAPYNMDMISDSGEVYRCLSEEPGLVALEAKEAGEAFLTQLQKDYEKQLAHFQKIEASLLSLKGFING